MGRVGQVVGRRAGSLTGRGGRASGRAAGRASRASRARKASRRERMERRKVRRGERSLKIEITAIEITSGIQIAVETRNVG